MLKNALFTDFLQIFVALDYCYITYSNHSKLTQPKRSVISKTASSKTITSITYLSRTQIMLLHYTIVTLHYILKSSAHYSKLTQRKRNLTSKTASSKTIISKTAWCCLFLNHTDHFVALHYCYIILHTKKKFNADRNHSKLIQ